MKMLVSVDGEMGERWRSKEMEEMVTEASPFTTNSVAALASEMRCLVTGSDIAKPASSAVAGLML